MLSDSFRPPTSGAPRHRALHCATGLLALFAPLACDPSAIDESELVTSTSSALSSSDSIIVGYVAPDLGRPDQLKPSQLESFSIVITDGAGWSTLSDADGYFVIQGVPSRSTPYTLEIRKRNHMTRRVQIPISGPSIVRLGSAHTPVDIWAGDIYVNGSNDGALNMTDIMQVAASFNTAVGQPGYQTDRDVNGDGAINMSDVMEIAKHFNRTYSAASISVEPRSTCYGGVGPGCDGVSIPLVSMYVPPAKLYRGMHGHPRIPVCVGSIIHDNCCWRERVVGPSCRVNAADLPSMIPNALYNDSIEECMPAWRKAFFNVKDSVGCWDQTFSSDDTSTLVRGRMSGIPDLMNVIRYVNDDPDPSKVPSYKWDETPTTLKLVAPALTRMQDYDAQFCDSGKVISEMGVSKCAPSPGQARIVITYVEQSEQTTLDVPVFVKNGTAFAPVRRLAEELGRKVSWNAGAGQVSIDGDVLPCSASVCYNENDTMYASVRHLACFLGMRVTASDGSVNIYMRRRSEASSSAGYQSCP